MSVLEQSTFFGGNDEISGDELGQLEVTNFTTDIDEALTPHFGWRGKATAAIGLALSPDNLRVDGGTFVVRGELELKDKRMPAVSIWPTANKDVVFQITFPRGDVFNFYQGGLCSNLVGNSMVPHVFFDASEGRGSRPLLAADPRLEGTEAGFCIRMVAQISGLSSASKGVIMRAAIMLFPSNVENVSEIEHSNKAGWPGLKIGEVFMPLGPAPTVKWRCPLLPFIKPRAQFEEDDVAPASDKLRSAIAAIMRSAKAHDGLKTGMEVLKKWELITANPRLMLDAEPNISWPDTTTQDAEDTSGKLIP